MIRCISRVSRLNLKAQITNRLKSSADQNFVGVFEITGDLIGAHRTVIQDTAVEEDLNQRGVVDPALNQSFRQRIFDVFLERPAQRSRAIAAIGASPIDDPPFSLTG